MTEFNVPAPGQGGGQVPKRRWSTLTIVAVGAVMLIPLSFALLGGLAVVRYQSFKSAGASMEPALMSGDRFYLDSEAYAHSAPSRGDIIAFIPPKIGRFIFVKRVVGLPGERVAFKNGILAVNGKPVSLSKLGDAKAIGMDPALLTKPDLVFYSETFSDGTSFRVAFDPKSKPVDVSEQVVPENNYYVVGDNRDYSNDSRFYGAIPRGDISGRVVVVWGHMSANSFWLGWRTPK